MIAPPLDCLVETHELTKRYGPQILAVDHLTLEIRRGEVYGFLGPNGAGKTTALRMLLGLIRPTSGTARVLGHRPGAAEGLARVGALIESPAFYPYLSGRDNLRVIADYAGVDRGRVGAALAQVDLSARATDAYRTYSLGMKQRLGVAAALLKDPDLLILDEPTNGLDPKGVAEMRALIRSIGQGERSVVLSSHLLGEVEQICDRVGVIQRGRLLVEGTLDDLRGVAGLFVRAEPIEEALRTAARIPEVAQATVVDGALHLTTSVAHAALVNRSLVEARLRVSEVRPLTHSLEDVFFDVTEGARGAS